MWERLGASALHIALPKRVVNFIEVLVFVKVKPSNNMYEDNLEYVMGYNGM